MQLRNVGMPRQTDFVPSRFGIAAATAFAFGLPACGLEALAEPPASTAAQPAVAEPAAPRAGVPPAVPPPTAPQPAVAPEPVAPNVPVGTVNFSRDVEPILKARCYSCHGPDLQHGGLRLDEREFAGAGGHSRRTILGGAVDENELIRRVTTSDLATRMPKNATPLTSGEIAILKSWVQDDSPWPVPVAESPVSAPSGVPSPPLPWWVTVLEWSDAIGQPIRPYAIPILIVSVLIGLVERYRTRQRKLASAAAKEGHPPPQPRFPRLLRITPSHYLNVVLVTVLAVIGVRHWKSTGAESTASPVGGIPAPNSNAATTSSSREQIQKTNSRFGTPPRPYRPHHPRQLEGTYFRGNCERNAKLYNGGNYCTARFHIWLCDEEGKPVVAGDPVPESGFFVQMDMERAAGTHESFFTKQIIEAVALSTQLFTSGGVPPREPLEWLSVVKPDWSWTVRYPLGKPTEERPDALDGTIYVYRGGAEEMTKASGRYAGDAHYGICAELKLKDGRLTADSDLWMGSLFVVPTLEFPDPSKVPLDEWFDFRPIPEIVGGNTTDDPKLLGLPAKTE